MLGMRAAFKCGKKELPVVSELVAESDLARVIASDRHRLDRGEEVRAGAILGAGLG
jgi:tyrosine-protein phosphatase YwqE